MLHTPLIDKNGNTVPVERDVDNKKLIDDNKKLADRYRWYDQVDDYDLVKLILRVPRRNLAILYKFRLICLKIMPYVM